MPQSHDEGGRLDQRVCFPNIVFRPVQGSREARLRGTRLSIWRIAATARELGTAEATAAHYGVAPTLIHEALAYAQEHPEEIEAAVAVSRSYDLERLQEMLPNIRVFDAD